MDYDTSVWQRADGSDRRCARRGRDQAVPRKIKTFAQERDYTSLTMPPIERRSLMESGMRRPTTRFDLLVIAVFLVALLAVLAYFLVPLIATLIDHVPDLIVSTGK